MATFIEGGKPDPAVKYHIPGGLIFFIEKWIEQGCVQPSTAESHEASRTLSFTWPFEKRVSPHMQMGIYRSSHRSPLSTFFKKAIAG